MPDDEAMEEVVLALDLAGEGVLSPLVTLRMHMLAMETRVP